MSLDKRLRELVPAAERFDGKPLTAEDIYGMFQIAARIGAELEREECAKLAECRGGEAAEGIDPTIAIAEDIRARGSK